MAQISFSLSGGFWPSSLPLFHRGERPAIVVAVSMNGSSVEGKEVHVDFGRWALVDPKRRFSDQPCCDARRGIPMWYGETLDRRHHMRRREFITLVWGGAAWPFAAHAQQRGRLPTIGYLGANTQSAMSQWTAAFVERLRELGWVEGRNLAIEYRWAEGRPDRAPEIIAEFVRLKVHVIDTHATVHVVGAERATSAMPIVFASVADPVGNNVVASLARPGGNVTGLSAQISDVARKRL